MVAVFNKKLLSWYLITLKLKVTIEAAGVVPSAPNSSRSADLLRRLPGPQETLDVAVEEGGSGIEDELNKSTTESDWVVSIRDRLDQACQGDVASKWAKLCIYKVPRYLRERNDSSYAPQIVSIGPYHHRNECLRKTNSHKWRSLQQIIRRTQHDVKIYLNALKEIEEKVRACYEGPVGFSSNELVEMMLLDGCFILELFRGANEGFEYLGYPRNDPIFTMHGSMHKIQTDLIMLENQLPLFVLDLLLRIQLGQPNLKGLVSKLAIVFFDPLTPSRNTLKSSLGYATTFNPLSDHLSLHCLEVFRRGLLRSGPRPEPRVWIKGWSYSNRVADKRQQLQLIHSATELREAGIKFKRRKTDRFWDVKFRNGILEIPRLLIHEGTKSLFLNLIAFEQCHLDSRNSNITSYVIFMDNLINSAADVGYLHYRGIIDHGLGSDAEVADLFNCLCQEVFFDASNSCPSPLSKEVNKYFNRRWNSWRASLKHSYFSNPWAIISFVAAVILLLVTLTQTFYTVYGYYRPRK